MINGAIENVTRLRDGSVQLNGWARHVSPDDTRPVEWFTLIGRNDAAISVTEREIGGTPGCGFRLVLPSAEDLAALYWGGLSLQAQAGDEILALRFWERIEEIREWNEGNRDFLASRLHVPGIVAATLGILRLAEQVFVSWVSFTHSMASLADGT